MPRLALILRGISLLEKNVREFLRTKGTSRIFDGLLLKTKGFLPKVYEGSEMPLVFLKNCLHVSLDKKLESSTKMAERH